MATERIIEHIDRLREKPEHVRHRIAVLTAAGISGLVAVTWMGAMASSGTLALKSDPQPAEPQATPSDLSESSFENLLGAAGAAFSTSSTTELSIVETRTSSTLDSQTKPANDTNKTVIPF